MFLLEALDIEKHYGERTVLKFPEFRIYTGDKIGVVGANGAGKSTLLKILSGMEKPDKGRVVSHAKIHFLEQFNSTDSRLSGGENQKNQILKLKGNLHNLVFADEPTANLDIDGRRWLEQQLEQLDTFLIISHDRALLDKLCNTIVEIKNGNLEVYKGNYTNYTKELERKKQVIEQKQFEYQKQKQQLERAVQKKESSIARSRQGYKKRRIKNTSEASLGKYRIEQTYKQKQGEMKVLKDRINRLEPAERIEKERRLSIDFSKTDPPQNRRIITADNFSFSYGKQKVFQNASFEVFREEKLAIVGDNGSGKTTLLREIYSKNSKINLVPKIKIGYLRQNFSELDMHKTVLENTLENSVQSQDVVYSVLAGLLFTGNDLDKPASVLSGGERVRLGLARQVVSDVNTLFLDEPTNFLDIPSLNALEDTLVDYPGAVVLVSHDRDFVDRVATRKLLVKDGKLINPKSQKPAVKVDLLTLELRRTLLVEKLSDASDEQREKLEKEYKDIIKQINNAG